MSKELKDWWDKCQVIGTISIPIVLAASGYFINATFKEKELKAEYVSIAVGVLKAQPTPETKSLRDWATKILNENSPIKLSKQAIEDLSSHPLPGTYVKPGYIEPGYVK